MRANFLAVAASIVWFLLAGPATAQVKNPALEGAQKFCAAQYGDRLLGVTMDGEKGFACRFAAVEKVATYKIAPTEPKPKWDLDEEDEIAALPAKQTAVAKKAKTAKKIKRKRRAKSKWRKKRRYKRAKLRNKQRYLRKRKAKRTKKKNPFAEFMRKVRKATQKRSSIEPRGLPRISAV